jgi:hypothetical protein
MDKVIRDGKVAVLISKGFGAGWYSCYSEYPELVFHPKLVEMVEQKRQSEITDEWLKEHISIDICCDGADDLEIVWIPQGTAFYIDEYNGAESVVTSARFNLIA